MTRLRVMTAEDWPLWRDARLAALADSPYAFKSRLADWHRGGEEQWRAWLADPGTYKVAALVDDRVVGTARGVPGGDGVCELRSLWVGPEARGRGVAGRLIESVAAWARGAGASTLRLTVIPDNGPALALYRRHGFTATDEPGDLLPDGVTRERVMVKALPDGTPAPDTPRG